MTLPDAVRNAVEHAVADAPSGEDLLSATLRREHPSRSWLPVAAVAAAVVAVVAGVTLVVTRDHAAPVVPATQAVAATDGIRISLKLDRSSARVGDLVHATATVTNTRSTAVRFGGSSCQAPENQPNVEVDLRPGQPRGRTWTGTAAEAKARALDGAPYTAAFGSREGSQVCLDYYRDWPLDPGKTLTVAVVWRAQTPLNSAYDGDGTVRAVFRFTEEAASGTPHEEVAARLPLHVTGGDPTVLTPAAAWDRALEDPAFARFVDAFPPATWSPEGPGPGVTSMPFYKDPTTGKLVHGDVWLVYLRRNVNARYGSLTLDPRTGGVLRRDLPPTKIPADSQTPAAGACGTASGPVATVELNPDVPLPRCLIVRADQQLRVVNTTARFGSPGQIVTVQWPPYAERRLAIGAGTTYDAPMGDYLAPGVHLLRSSLYGGSAAAIWLKP